MNSYEKKYKDALERAKELYNNPNSSNIGKSYLYSVFDELKESEDEKIRKAIKQHILFLDDSFPDKGNWLAWLEKQGEQKPTDGTFVDIDDVREDFMAKVYRVLDADPNDIANQIIDAFDSSLTKSSQETQGKTAIEAINEEKVDNANKVEPKFKVGDWVVGRATNNEPRQIAEITDQGYKSTYGGWYGFSYEDDIHLWTIEDAKEGDLIYVSTEEKGIHAIFHKFENGIIYFHCYLCGDFTQGGYMPIGDVEQVYPLQKTHYQRFFQKMEEAGYEWDVDKLDGNQINWLKSIRPQNKWKPSEEQMKALNAMILNGGLSYMNQNSILIGLYEQLKKLKD